MRDRKERLPVIEVAKDSPEPNERQREAIIEVGFQIAEHLGIPIEHVTLMWNRAELRARVEDVPVGM